ncbi:putative metallopeptidase [Xanthobacteraceae bacterium A53D]
MGTVVTIPRRPPPPAAMLEDMATDAFAPSDELRAWAFSTFIDEGAVLENEEHAHLRNADIGFLWTNVANARQGRAIIGQAELGEPQGAMGKWAKARARAQVRGWFGGVPDFIITIDATWSAEADDASFCALLEHELYHCAQERDGFGMPRFDRYGRPVFGMRGHDVEQFIGVVRRWQAHGSRTPAGRAKGVRPRRRAYSPCLSAEETHRDAPCAPLSPRDPTGETVPSG